MDAKTRGRWGEGVACAYLQARGWTVMERNVRVGHREIDIVARRGRIVAFVEVKTRASLRFGHPLEAITWKKRAEIVRVARTWLVRHPHLTLQPRFDAISIIERRAQSPVIEHIEGAWFAG